jgi:hypothetical protein
MRLPIEQPALCRRHRRRGHHDGPGRWHWRCGHDDDKLRAHQEKAVHASMTENPELEDG